MSKALRTEGNIGILVEERLRYEAADFAREPLKNIQPPSSIERSKMKNQWHRAILIEGSKYVEL